MLDPHISEHLSHFGIDMLQMQKRVSCLDCADCVLFTFIYILAPSAHGLLTYTKLKPKLIEILTPSSPLSDFRQRMGTTQTKSPGRGSVNGR